MVRDPTLPQWFVRLMSPVAALTHASGQEGAARQMLDECRGLFDASFQEINPVYRNRTMVALAEGYFAIGDPGEACAAYLAGFEHSAANPNGRPQMQAIVQVACSYAVHGEFENKEVSARLRAVGNAFGSLVSHASSTHILTLILASWSFAQDAGALNGKGDGW